MAIDDKNEEKSQVLESALPKGTRLVSKSREYKVIGVLGAGGFGITYKVSSRVKVGNVELETFFAVKEFFIKGCYRGGNQTQVFCAPTAKKDFEEGQKDFKLEAERLNKLGRMSTNIVKVNEIFFANDTVYYVMEYLEGGDLVHCIKENGNEPLSEARALAILLPVIRAVEQIHKEGLLHLDIKPDNIVLKKNGENEVEEPVLIDFGIAKHFDHNGRPTSHLVAKGASDGYAPMEQYTDIDSFTPEIDVYAIGATLYYLLTAKNPPKAFDIHSVSDLIDRIPGNVSERTKKVIAGAMQKSKFDRIHDARSLLRELSTSYTLPVGCILHGQHADYRIVEVESESDCSITYKAIVSHSLGNNASEQASGENRTRVSVHYLVHEFFLKHVDKRGDDGTVSPGLSGKDVSSFLREVGREIAPDSLDRLDECGHVLAEKFNANGTLYYVGIVRPKNPVGKDVVENTMKRVKAGKKFVLVAVAACLVVFAAMSLMRRSPRRDDSAKKKVPVTMEEKVQYAYEGKDKETLLILARDSGYLKAYCSLAQLYLDEGDNDNALKYAKKLDTMAYPETRPIIKKVVLQKVGVLNQQLDAVVQNFSSDANRRVDQLVKAKKIQESIVNLAEPNVVPYTENEQLRKQINSDFNAWKKAGDSNPVNSVRINCYEIALKLKWDESVQLKLDELKMN